MIKRSALMGGLLSIALVSPLFAQSQPASESWTVTIGGAVRLEPSFMGSDELSFGFAPRFGLRAPGRKQNFSSFDDGISPAVYDTGSFRIGPNIAFTRARDSGSEADLNGLRDVDFTLETGLFAEVYPADWLRLRGTLRYGFFGHDGIVGTVGADAIWQPGPAWTFAAGPRLRYGDDQFTSAYFDVSPAESAAFGLPANDASGGITSFGLVASATRRFDSGLAITGFASYDRLSGDAADAPLVRLRGREDQFVVGTSVTYSFPVGW